MQEETASPRDSELDERTLQRAQEGEEAACRALVRRYERPVFALLTRLLATERRALVPDLAQETFLRVFRQLARFEVGGPARLSTWILTIAARLAIDERRRHRVTQAAACAPEPLAEGSTDEIAVGRETALALEAAFAALPEESRVALVLRIEHELEYEPIAQVLGVEIGTVKSRLARARAALREALERATR